MLSHKHKRQTAFIVAVTVTTETGVEADAVTYAAMKPSAEEALASIQAVVDVHAHIAIVGKLSAQVAKAINLKRDEIRVI
ncbi:hypothetical protein FPV16_21165 [Methylobacterium sp. W2]|uniref:hypothetical protein n=1 Tax=Methylobacterium sp. W2 TaxID=2598107 RepID=UPI001D0C1601|nr:hypothetical protein [Methylobacterium sp. W2]MCC0808686.1 hypothetical protein [Methylobacterium sp. W2]